MSTTVAAAGALLNTTRRALFTPDCKLLSVKSLSVGIRNEHEHRGERERPREREREGEFSSAQLSRTSNRASQAPTSLLQEQEVSPPWEKRSEHDWKSERTTSEKRKVVHFKRNAVVTHVLWPILFICLFSFFLLDFPLFYRLVIPTEREKSTTFGVDAARLLMLLLCQVCSRVYVQSCVLLLLFCLLPSSGSLSAVIYGVASQ